MDEVLQSIDLFLLNIKLELSFFPSLNHPSYNLLTLFQYLLKIPSKNLIQLLTRIIPHPHILLIPRNLPIKKLIQINQRLLPRPKLDQLTPHIQNILIRYRLQILFFTHHYTSIPSFLKNQQENKKRSDLSVPHRVQ